MRIKILYNFFAYLCIYILIIFRWGYEFGRGDQMQILAYALYLNDNSLYLYDHYIQNIAHQIPNERLIISYIFSFFSSNLETFCLIAHCLCSLFLLHGLYKIASMFIKINIIKWFFLCILFIPLYNINLGGNELYYNSFFVSNLVKTMGIWSIYFLLSYKFTLAFIIYSIISFLQAVVGTQLFLISSCIIFISKLFKLININWKKLIVLNLIFLLTAGIWLLLLYKTFNAPNFYQNKEFFNILFVFRSPHHYWPSSFPLKSYIILIPLFIFASIYFYKKNKLLFLFFIVSILACCIYTIGVEVLHSNNIAAIQWFKITIWLKAFSLIALFAFLEKYFAFTRKKMWQILGFLVLSCSSIFCIILIFLFPETIPMKVNYDLGNQYSDPAVDIALKAQKYTPKNALFIHPLLFTELKYYGKRSSYVDYKILVHTKPAMIEWYKRIKQLYGISTKNYQNEKNRPEIANNYFLALNKSKLTKLAKQGATHIITFKQHKLDLPLITQNNVYKICKLVKK